MTGLSRVVPAVLTDEPKALEKMVRQAEGFTDYVQFDIMDGKFVPSRSVTYEHLAALTTKLNWEVHLMVQQPEYYIESFQKAGARKVVFHYEATSSPERVISLARNLGLGVGLAVNPETQVSAILPLVEKIDSVLLLTASGVGSGGIFAPDHENTSIHSCNSDLSPGLPE